MGRKAKKREDAGKSRGQMSLVGYSLWDLQRVRQDLVTQHQQKCVHISPPFDVLPTLVTTEHGANPHVLSSYLYIGEGNGTPLQYSCLENFIQSDVYMSISTSQFIPLFFPLLGSIRLFSTPVSPFLLCK